MCSVIRRPTSHECRFVLPPLTMPDCDMVTSSEFDATIPAVGERAELSHYGITISKLPQKCCYGHATVIGRLPTLPRSRQRPSRLSGSIENRQLSV
ncbi:hypothetical protein EJ03DRAFT_114922 [Teratosphaeria nubilosa]|uniref:Uncharacterized protein n=1 Tax=Teratosphaeria nubilosa TaxID=161662 RepID=A0A6G1L7F8_9PEZI|nr:hypothetical protein EJ03DRAFT_114922 [Teratosphaeria nubilosa]